jgi:hypothetical protein
MEALFGVGVISSALGEQQLATKPIRLGLPPALPTFANESERLVDR